MERDLTGKIYRSRDGSPETDRFPVKSRHMCQFFYNTNYHSQYATGEGDSRHLSWLRCYNQDLHSLNLKAEWAQDRTKWKGSVVGNSLTRVSMENGR